MLIRLTIENFLSFNERIELLLTPGKARNLVNHIIKRESRKDLSILKSAVIYGANASGKSNFSRVLFFLKKMVTRPGVARETIAYEKFKLDRDAADRPSRIEVEFHFRGQNYAYGFGFDRQVIHEEWLYRFDCNRDWKIFERTTNKDMVSVDIGHLADTAEDRKRLEYIGADTQPTELFLNTSNHRNIRNISGIAPLTDAYAWFDESLAVIFPDSKMLGLEVNIDSDARLREIFQWFLAEFKTGITGLETVNIDFFSKEVDLPEKLKQRIAQDLKIGERAMVSSLDHITYSLSRNEEGSIEAIKLMTQHPIKNSPTPALFEINEESDGTQRIMDLIPAIAELAKEERVIVVDEIDRSLHPMLTRKLFELYFRESAGIKSQLICTTHESQLLDQDLLRKDEIWFVKKDVAGASSLYSLEEFKERKDADIRTGYLKGRYNAIPHFSAFSDTPW
jgi:AAA15 family ATPase/GTPase